MPTAQRTANVFVNCPFDPAYQPILDSIVFAVTACGYRVRSALEASDSGDLRLRKIIGLLEQSALSIHDISRMELDARTTLPRFDMPIELGIALGMKHLGRKALQQHRMLVVDKEQYRYRNSASDLGGLDIEAHLDDPIQVIAAVGGFLATGSTRHLPTEDTIETAYAAFQTELPRMAAAAKQSVAKLTFTDRLGHLESFPAELS